MRAYIWEISALETMEEASEPNSHQVIPLSIDDVSHQNHPHSSQHEGLSRYCVTACFMKMLIAELIGTYFLVFAGCAAIVVNTNMGGVVTLPGIAIVWGLVLMVMIYSLGHISGAHFNPAVTIALASCKLFPLKQVPAYITLQVLGSILASGTLRLLFPGKQNQFAGTLPAGTEVQSLVVEFTITFLFMFVISSLTTDNRATRSFAGLAIGATLSINVLIAGPVSGASVNPARSLGPAIVSSSYTGLWIYIVGPICGAVAGAWVYKIISLVDKSLRDISKSESILRRSINMRPN